ncbi:MAG: hypothetical protein B6A08_03530 [Sorangiineae bacterium NIC37A_2]|jgi:bacterioferritin-associated ferredoxin|nr:MAG: hypothetical protein B6A08_03530 [Sorangiineae bacterium NIC37A_2]
MILCHCSKVTDRAIESALDEGASSLEEVRQLTRAGRCCGGCLPAVAELVSRRIPLRIAPAGVDLAAE